MTASVPGLGFIPAASRIAIIRPSVALATARLAPWPPNSCAVTAASKPRTSGPLLLNTPDASTRRSASSCSLSRGGLGAIRGRREEGMHGSGKGACLSLRRC